MALALETVTKSIKIEDVTLLIMYSNNPGTLVGNGSYFYPFHSSFMLSPDHICTYKKKKLWKGFLDSFSLKCI